MSHWEIVLGSYGLDGLPIDARIVIGGVVCSTKIDEVQSEIFRRHRTYVASSVARQCYEK
jgi:hypothetical protein